ncbi:hypothetical protein H6503_05005 [Candidatus Woesearchaeota archaeon]|nr:hypothetical protein [Candidatus Woesearchaeota archaeon]
MRKSILGQKTEAAIIGRYQPVHNGHVGVFEEVDDMGLDRIILAIGLEGKGRTERNPYTFEEIHQMWLPIVRKAKTKVEIFAIPDINDQPNYAEHVEDITGCNQARTIIVSGNQYTLDCFTNFGKHYHVFRPEGKSPMITEAGSSFLNATEVRYRIKNDLKWQHLVPDSTREQIERLNRTNYETAKGGQYAEQRM